MDVVDANSHTHQHGRLPDACEMAAAAAAAGTDSGAQRVLHPRVALAANEGKDVPYIQNKAALLGVSLSDFTSLGVEYLNLADTNFNLNRQHKGLREGVEDVEC